MANEGSVFTGTLQTWGPIWGLTATLADFSSVVTPGHYCLQAGPVTSTHFHVDSYAYRLLDPPNEIAPGAVFPEAIFDSFFAYQRSDAPDLDLPVYMCTAAGEEPGSASGNTG